VGPSLLVGTPITGSTDRAAIEAYYSHGVLLPFGLGAIAIIISFLVFVTALRETLLPREAARFWANLGFAFALVAASLLLVRSALQMALVRGVAVGSDVTPLFFAWDFAYNSALYAMEAGYPLAFALGIAAHQGTPRWFLGLAAVASALQLVNMTSLVLGLPMAATLPGNLAIAAWFAATAWLMGRRQTVGETTAVPIPGRSGP
jgi:hypothetical protein